MQGVMVTLSGVTRRFTSGERTIQALDDVSIEVPAGSVTAITGPSGAGKSTLLHVVGAMDRPDEGEIRVGGTDVAALSSSEQVAYRRTLGFVFQRFHLLPALTALDNVAAPLLPYRGAFDKFARARELLGAVGLDERAESLPSQLSGGEQQRVAIARALINEPNLVLADEPTGNLDSATGAEIVELLLKLREERGMTVLISSHNPRVAARCDRIVRLQDGRVLDSVEVVAEDPDAALERISRIGP